MPRDPKKINPYVIFDWETGGLKAKDSPVMELACIGINGLTLEEVIRYDNLIKPYDKALPYQPGALAVNGLSIHECEKKGIPLSQLMTEFCQVCEETNTYGSKTAKPILVAHNAKFDKSFLLEVLRRTKVDLSKYVEGEFDGQGTFIPETIDTIQLAKACWAEVTDNDTKFKLGACCERAGVSYADGHKGMNDCESTVDLFRYFLTRIRSGSSEVTVTDGKATASHRLVFEW